MKDRQGLVIALVNKSFFGEWFLKRLIHILNKSFNRALAPTLFQLWQLKNLDLGEARTSPVLGE